MRVGIIGAGPAGITAAYQLAKAGAQVEVFEAGDNVGGLSRTIDLWGQKVDLGPHRFFSNDKRVNDVWLEVVGRDYRMVDRLTRIYYKSRFFHYPLKPANALWNMGIARAAQCMGSYLHERVRPSFPADCNETFESWVVGRFGRQLFEMFFKSYSEKLWGIACDELDADFAAQRIKKFSLGEAVKAALGFGKDRHKTLVDQFAYPTGGTGMVYERMAERIAETGGGIHLRTPVARLIHHDKVVHGVELVDGRIEPFDHVISTMPLTLLVRSLGDLPAEVERGVNQLRFRNTILVYLNADSTQLFKDQWLYIHSPELGMGRVTNFRNWVPELYGDADTSILALEYWCYDEDELWHADDSTLVNLAAKEIRATGLTGSAKILAGHVQRIRRCYPVYERGYKKHLEPVIEHVRGYENLQAIGRYGSFKYNNQDHSILMGVLAAENILTGAGHDLWAVNTDSEYQESADVAKTGLQRGRAPKRVAEPVEAQPMLWNLFALDPARLTLLERTLLRVALAITVGVIGWTYLDIRVHPGDDLRNRVVGARVMLAGEDPYTFVWQSGMPEELLDPVYDPHAHRLTISPPTLLLYVPMAPLSWHAVRFVSYLAEWAALIGSLILLTRSLPEARQRVILLLGAVMFVIATDVWRLHIERGQIYVFYLLALSAAIYWSQRGEIDSIPAGIALGVLALLRPNLLIMAPALLVTRRWRMAGAMLATVGVGMLATIPALPAESWKSYLGVGDQYYRSIQGDPIVTMDWPAHEGSVEGVEFAGEHSLHNVESSSFAMLWRTLHDCFGTPMLDLALVSKAILALLTAAMFAIVWVRRNASQSGAFALIVVLSLVTEFFLPHRWGYADVMLLAPVGLLLPALLRQERVNMQALAIVLLGLCSGPLGQQFFGLYLATVLRSWLVMGGLAMLVLADSSEQGTLPID